MLEESDKEVYRSRKLIEVPATEPIEEEHRTESFRLKVNELLELARSKFWEALERGDEDGVSLIRVPCAK